MKAKIIYGWAVVTYELNMLNLTEKCFNIVHKSWKWYPSFLISTVAMYGKYF